MNNNCLSEELIARYAEGITSKPEQLLIIDHCKSCKDCSVEVIATIQILHHSANITLNGYEPVFAKAEKGNSTRDLAESPNEKEAKIVLGRKSRINPVVWLVAAIFLILFLAGFFHAHILGIKPENLKAIASQHIQAINENGSFAYAFADEIYVYNGPKAAIQILPNNPNIKEQLLGKGQDIMEASAGYVGIGVLFSKVFHIKMSGRNAAYYYIGATVAIVGGYGLGYYIHEKYFPAQNSKAMKKFLRDGGNWREVNYKIPIKQRDNR